MPRCVRYGADNIKEENFILPESVLKELQEVGRCTCLALHGTLSCIGHGPMPRCLCPPRLACSLPHAQEASVMTRMRHPNVVSFMGLSLMPPLIVTGGSPEAKLLASGVVPTISWPLALALCTCYLQASSLTPVHHAYSSLPAAEFCEKGSLYDVLRRARQADKAAELTWQLRIQMVRQPACTLLGNWALLIVGDCCRCRRLMRLAACCTCTVAHHPSSTET